MSMSERDDDILRNDPRWRQDAPSWRDDPPVKIVARDLPRLDVGAAFAQEPPALDYVLPGYTAGSVGSIVAAGATGKSMLALQLAVHLAGGADTLALAGLAKWTPTTGRILYLSGEDPDPVLAQRLHAIGKHLSDDERARAASNLHAAPLVGLGARIDDAVWRLRIEQAATGCRLVIVDTLRRFHVSDENNGGEMAALLATIEKICLGAGTSVLFLHHVSKASALNGSGEQQASRGSSVLTDNVRWQANLATMTTVEAAAAGIADDKRRIFVRLGFTKVNYGPPIEDCWFRRGAGGVLLPEPAVVAALALAGAAKAAGKGSRSKGGGGNGTAKTSGRLDVQTPAPQHDGGAAAAAAGDAADDVMVPIGPPDGGWVRGAWNPAGVE